MDACRWQPSSTAPALSKRASTYCAGLPGALPSRRSSKPAASGASKFWKPAALARTWCSHGSLLTKVPCAPTATSDTAGTKRIFSCAIVTFVGSGLGVPGAAGASTTTASGTGLPSLSSTVTFSAPAWAQPKASAPAASASNVRVMAQASADDVPDLVVVVAVLVARVLVLRPRVQRPALVRPLARTVVAHHDGVVTVRLRRRGCHVRRP